MSDADENAKRKELLAACKIVEAFVHDIGAFSERIDIGFVAGRVTLDILREPPDEDHGIDAPDLFTALVTVKGR